MLLYEHPVKEYSLVRLAPLSRNNLLLITVLSVSQRIISLFQPPAEKIISTIKIISLKDQIANLCIFHCR